MTKDLVPRRRKVLGFDTTYNDQIKVKVYPREVYDYTGILYVHMEPLNHPTEIQCRHFNSNDISINVFEKPKDHVFFRYKWDMVSENSYVIVIEIFFMYGINLYKITIFTKFSRFGNRSVLERLTFRTELQLPTTDLSHHQRLPT